MVGPLAPAELQRVRRLIPDAAAVAGYVALTIYATWPLARFAASRVPQNLADPLENTWIFSWGAHALAHSPMHLFDANMFYPDRYTLAFAENMLGLSLPLAPLYWLTGNGLLLVNVATLAIYVVGAFGTFLLAQELGATRPVAFLAGAGFAFAPYRLGQLAHPHVLGIHMVPFILIVLLRLSGDRGRRRHILALALLVAAQFWASLSGGLMAGCVVAAWAAWMVLARRRAAIPALARAALGSAAGLVLVTPVAFAYLEAKRLHPEYAHPVIEHYQGSATLGSYLDPAPRNSGLVNGSYRWLDRRFGRRPAAEKELFAGWWLLAGAAAAGAGAAWSLSGRAFRGRSGGGPPTWWAPAGLVAVIAVSGFALSLGPRWGGRPTGFPLPGLVVTHLVPGGLMRVPARFGSVTLLSLALALGLGVARLRPSFRRVAVTALGLAMLVEVAPSTATYPPPPMTDAHRAVAHRPGAVLALPTLELRPDGTLFGLIEHEPLQIYLSTAHFRPLINGYGAFLPAHYLEVVRAVQDFPTSGSLRALAHSDVRTVVVDTRLMEGSRWADAASRLDAWPGVRLIVADGGVRTYDISAAR